MITTRIKKILKTSAALAVLFFLTTYSYADVKIAIIDSGSQEPVFGSVSFTSIPANQDPISHGTNIARIIKQDNPLAKIFMLQVCEEINGHYSLSSKSVLKAIEWCMKNNIDIVNLSLVLPYNKEIEEAINRAHQHKGIIFVAAAGNKNAFSQFAVKSDGYVYLSKPNEKPSFPASCNYVISVGARGTDGKVAIQSKTEVDVFSRGDYQGLWGTSFACARITEEASKILASNPNISLEQLKQALFKIKSK